MYSHNHIVFYTTNFVSKMNLRSEIYKYIFYSTWKRNELKTFHAKFNWIYLPLIKPILIWNLFSHFSFWNFNDVCLNCFFIQWLLFQPSINVRDNLIFTRWWFSSIFISVSAFFTDTSFYLLDLDLQKLDLDPTNRFYCEKYY